MQCRLESRHVNNPFFLQKDAKDSFALHPGGEVKMYLISNPSKAMVRKLETAFGEQLLESILKDGRKSTSTQAGLAAGYFSSRIEGKRLQLANQDRARPVAATDTLGHHQIQKRNKRLLKKKSHYARGDSKGKINCRNIKEEKVPLSRRERQRLGLEVTDENLTFESLIPIHQLWLDYIHRLLGFIDENGSVQSNQVQVANGGQNDGEVTISPNALNAFQSSLVKADFCGAPLRGESCSTSTFVSAVDFTPT